MIKERIRKLRAQFKELKIDGYIIPKNDEFFSEHTQKDRLKFITNFSGSAGYAIILKNKNYLFVDGRYTIQAQIESKKYYKIVDYHKIINCNLFKNLTIGIDPKIFTSTQIKRIFSKKNNVKILKKNLIDKIWKNKLKKSKKFFSLKENIIGENFKKKINKVNQFLKKNKLDYMFISAPENVAWLLNIRGHDNPHSPIPNCQAFIENKKLYLISNISKTQKLIKEKKLSLKQIIDPINFIKFIESKKKGKILIDDKSCSLHIENIFKKI